ncbi:hypothetical protein [Bacillus subtilis]|uniref:hypothetical protein n=1 Tax=Bacillus subtilis TaxID=1423 RepID=UPI0009285804|nr:hypothetical protein [Bacillus subtilis]MDO3655405.1 hypothetical protein [Bacillus subtilis]MEC2297055.1 hypothetical protein [Bacillus subtilis]OJH64074.1 hypothetical protein BOH71_07000 [Bacillus subtilis]GLI90748.1 hypothetical protein ANABIO4_41000 [Bacillus subtilis]
MNAKGIKIFKEHCKIGDELSVCFKSSEGSPSKHYAGFITDITESKVCLKSNDELDLFDRQPATRDIPLSSIYYFWNRTNGFTF